MAGEGQRRLDPGRHLFLTETRDEVVLGHEAANPRWLSPFAALQALVMRVLHLEHPAVAALDHAGHRNTIALVELPGDKGLVEPGDANPGAAVVADGRLSQLHPLEPRDLGRDRGDHADHGCLDPRRERRNRGRVSIGLPAEGQLQKKVANRHDAELLQVVDVGGLDLGQRRHRAIQGVREHKYAHEVRSAIVAVVVAVIVLVGIIGYAVVGFAYTSTRIASADRSLNAVISHQNNLNSTFKDIDKQFNGLSSSSTFNPTQSRVAVDQFIANAKGARTMADQDDASLVSARAGLEAQKWLTAFSRTGLDRESARIGHARKALSNARSIAVDYAKDGEFFKAFLDSLLDLDGTLALSANGDIAGAKGTVPKLKTHVDSALLLSTAPGLPSEIQTLMVDFETLVADFGTLLDALAANDSPAIVTAGRAVEADGTKIGSYDFTKMGLDIDAYYKPRVDAFNSEMTKATSA